MLLNECTFFVETDPNVFIQEDISDVTICYNYENCSVPFYSVKEVKNDLSEETYKVLKGLLDGGACCEPSHTYLRTSTEGTKKLIESWISSTIKNQRKLYNPKKQTFTLLDEDTLKSTKVKKCNADEEDLEKAYMYALLKSFGITPAMIQKEVDGIKYQYKGKVLSKKEYEALLEKKDGQD